MSSYMYRVFSARAIKSVAVLVVLALVGMSMAACQAPETDSSVTAAVNQANQAAQEAAAAAKSAADAAEKASMAVQDTTAATAVEEAKLVARDAATAAMAAASAAQEASSAAKQAAETVMAAPTTTDSSVTAAVNQANQAAQEAAAAAKSAADAADKASMAAQDTTAATAAEEAKLVARDAVTAAMAAASAAQEASSAAKQVANTVMAAPTTLKEDPGSLVIYSGRSESLVAPIIEQFAEATGIDVQVKYGGTFALAATLLEEGPNSPADVFFAQDPGGLGAVSSMLSALPADVVLKVPEWARASDGSWVGISGRARVLVYSTELVSEDELPTSVKDLADPKWKGKIGWPPGNASFRTMVTAMRLMWGEDETRQWLLDMQANEPGVFPKNTPIVAAAGAGEVAIGLVNHYYLHRFIQESGDDFAARNLFLKNGGPDSLVMVAGAGLLGTGENRDNAEAFMRFLLSKVAQQYFAGQTFEYPLVEGVKTHRLLPPIDTLNGPDINLSTLSDLAGTDALLRETGVTP